MKIVVIGGTGMIGSKVVANLTQRGHEAVAASPNTGVNNIRLYRPGYTAANTRFNPNETTIGPANVGRLVVGAEQAPTLGPGWNASQASGVAVAGGRAYVQVGNFESGTSALLAYDTRALQSPPLWQQRSGCNNASPTVHLSIVFVGAIACRPSGDDGGVRAFDAATGRQLWYSHELGIGNGTEDASNVAATSGAVYFSLYELSLIHI